MKKLLPCLAVLVVLSVGALPSHATSVWDSIFQSSGYNSKSGSFSSIPTGAILTVEASGNEATAAAYAHASGGGLNLTAYWTGPGGTSYSDRTLYADTVSYELWVSGYGYSFVEIDW